MPQNKPITYIAQIEYLQSYEVIKKLINEFCFISNKKFEIELLNKVKINNPDTYDLSMEDSFDFLKYELNFDMLKIFDYLSNKHFLIDNGKVKLCGKTLEEYHLLSSSIDTSPLISSFVLEFTQYLDDANRLRYIDNNFNISPSFYGKLENKITSISDNHIHLGGALNFDFRLHKIIQDPDEVNISKKPDELFIKLTECHLSIKNIIYAISTLETIIIQLCILNKNDSKYSQIMQNLTQLLIALSNDNYSDIRYISDKYNYSIRDKNNNQFFYIIKDDLENEFLRKSLEYFRMDFIPKADKFLMIFLIKILSTHSKLKEPIEIYIILRNILKIYIVQQHRREGFGYFSTYTENSIRRAKDLQEKENIIKSIFCSKIATNIEGRITFKNDETKLIASMLEYIIPFEKIKKKRGNKDNLKFMFHFVKDEDKRYDTINKYEFLNIQPRWGKLREEYKQQATVLNNILTNPVYRKYSEFKSKRKDFEEKILNSCINLSAIDEKCLKEETKTIDFIGNYISGIDGANKEYKTPPEVFAPIYRFFKNSIETSGLVLKREYPFIDLESDKIKELNFQYSFHAGEDFRDILSGLRAIFETVLYLDFKENDRIGHALALGVDAKEFYKNRENRKLSKLEVLDNSIFAYYILSKYSHNFITIKDNIKDRILGLSKEIYNQNNENNYHIDDFIDAWFLRRNCPNEILYCMNLFKNDLPSDKISIYNLKKLLENENYYPIILNLPFIKSALPDFFPFKKKIKCNYNEKYRSIRNNKNAYEIYWRYNTDPYVKIEGAKLYKYDDIYKPKFYEYMQDIIMEDIIAKEDIIIETLPSSNILIGQFKHYNQHPITRFKPIKNKIKPNKFGIRKRKIRVIIGTDNPGLQNTTLLGEVYQIKNALEKSEKYSKEDIEKYLIDIIKEGNELYNNE